MRLNALGAEGGANMLGDDKALLDSSIKLPKSRRAGYVAGCVTVDAGHRCREGGGVQPRGRRLVGGVDRDTLNKVRALILVQLIGQRRGASADRDVDRQPTARGADATHLPATDEEVFKPRRVTEIGATTTHGKTPDRACAEVVAHVLVRRGVLTDVAVVVLRDIGLASADASVIERVRELVVRGDEQAGREVAVQTRLEGFAVGVVRGAPVVDR